MLSGPIQDNTNGQLCTAVDSVAEKGCSLTQGACRNTGSTTMTAASQGTARGWTVRQR